MGLFGLGLPEIAVIGGVAALIFGALSILINIPSGQPPLLQTLLEGANHSPRRVSRHSVTFTLHGWS